MKRMRRSRQKNSLLPKTTHCMFEGCMHELLREDNGRCYELEQDIYKVGDASVGIAASNLQCPEAEALRTEALATLGAARILLDKMYESELAYVQHRTYVAQPLEHVTEDNQ